MPLGYDRRQTKKFKMCTWSNRHSLMTLNYFIEAWQQFSRRVRFSQCFCVICGCDPYKTQARTFPAAKTDTDQMKRRQIYEEYQFIWATTIEPLCNKIK